MAIAFDAQSQGSGSGDFSWSHTTTGANRILFVGVTVGSTGSVDSTGVTYGGVSMTGSIAGTSITGKFRTRLYYLIAPTTGSNTVVVSIAAGGAGAAWAASYTGASQTGQPDAATSFDADPVGAASKTMDITTIADNCWVVLMATTDANAIAAGTGATARGTDQTANSKHGLLMDSNGAVTPAGIYSMTYSFSSSQASSLGIASFSPAVAAAAPEVRQVPQVIIFS